MIIIIMTSILILSNAGFWRLYRRQSSLFRLFIHSFLWWLLLVPVLCMSGVRLTEKEQTSCRV